MSLKIWRILKKKKIEKKFWIEEDIKEARGAAILEDKNYCCQFECDLFSIFIVFYL